MLTARNRVAVSAAVPRPNPSSVPAKILGIVSRDDCSRRVQGRRKVVSPSAPASSAGCVGLIDMRPRDVVSAPSLAVPLVERAMSVPKRSPSAVFVGSAARGGAARKSDARRQDKKGSLPDGQAIGMAWLPASRSVGARAALKQFANAIKLISGTVHDFNVRGPLQ